MIDHFTDKKTIYSCTRNVIELIPNCNGRMGVWQNNRMYLCLLAICNVIEEIWPMKTLQIQNMSRRNEMQSHFVWHYVWISWNSKIGWPKCIFSYASVLHVPYNCHLRNCNSLKRCVEDHICWFYVVSSFPHSSLSSFMTLISIYRSSHIHWSWWIF